MKPMPLLIAVGLLAILGGFVYYTEEHPPAPDDAQVNVVDLKAADIQAVTVRRPGHDPLTVRRAGDRDWVFAEPATMKVDGFAVETLIANLTPMSASRVVEEKVSDWAPFGLAGEGALHVEVEAKEGKSYQITFGNNTPTGSAVYASLEGDPRLFTLSSSVKSGFEKEPFDLRDKKLLAIDTAKVSRLVLKTGSETLEFGKSGDDKWQILQPKPLRADNFAVGDLARALQSAEMTGVLAEAGAPADQYSFAKPYAAAEVTSEDGTHTLTVAQGQEDTFYAQSSDLAGGVYEVSKTLADGLRKQLSDFRNKKLFDFGYQDPAKLELRDGETRLTIAKKGDDWVAASDGDRKLDAAKAQSVIDSLRNLTATSFASDEAADQAKYGLDNPVIEAAVTSAENDEQEKVVISATAQNRFYAAVPGLPTTYELEKSSFDQIRKAMAEALKPAESPEATEKSGAAKKN
jgi:Domain of unknown function (DUF4340)